MNESTRAAKRAAIKIIMAHKDKQTSTNYAQIIDEETHLPELVEALKFLTHLCVNVLRQRMNPDPTDVEYAITQAEKAIAKAEGGI